MIFYLEMILKVSVDYICKYMQMTISEEIKISILRLRNIQKARPKQNHKHMM